MAEHTVLTFVYAEFHGNWKRELLTTLVGYEAEANGQVVVVAEGATGVKETYWYNVPTGEVVWVSYGENLAFIPERCLRRAPGDQTSCKQKG